MFCRCAEGNTQSIVNNNGGLGVGTRHNAIPTSHFSITNPRGSTALGGATTSRVSPNVATAADTAAIRQQQEEEKMKKEYQYELDLVRLKSFIEAKGIMMVSQFCVCCVSAQICQHY